MLARSHFSSVMLLWQHYLGGVSPIHFVKGRGGMGKKMISVQKPHSIRFISISIIMLAHASLNPQITMINTLVISIIVFGRRAG